MVTPNTIQQNIGGIKGYNSGNALTGDDISDIMRKKGTMSNVDVRKWYIEQDAKIPDQIDKSAPLETQARQAWALRNRNRTIARDLMKDQELRKQLDITDPNLSFEELLRHKMEDKHLTYEEALKDIIRSSTKTRQSVNESLGIT